MENAKKHGDDKGKLEISAIHFDRAIVISVKNSGTGIPKEDQEKIFDKFYRSKEAVVKKRAGSGLGLAIVKSVVEAHGGRVRCESEMWEKARTISF